MTAHLTDDPIDAAALLATVSSERRGAVVLFLGTARNHHRGRAVALLAYDAYRPMAEARLGRIVEELSDEAQEVVVAIVHRLGEVPAGAASVGIAVASPHRDIAYEVSRLALERLKKEVPIWKREHYVDGEAVWREDEPLWPRPTLTAPR